jgi:hypothetical protein
MEAKVKYFETPGEENTDEVLELVAKKASGREVEKVVLASTTGATAIKARDAFRDSDIQLVVVPHQYGFRGEPSKFPEDLAESLRDEGHMVHWGTMLFHTRDLYRSGGPRAIATTLRCFCQGMKVCFELTYMAADGGCIGDGEEIIAVAGTGSGADTAVYATASTSQAPGDLNIHEILCMPR